MAPGCPVDVAAQGVGLCRSRPRRTSLSGEQVEAWQAEALEQAEER